jgi:inosine/xanthosine triphosphatase
LADADYWVGIEGGVEDQANEMAAFAWVVILSVNGGVGKGRTGTFFLPEAVAELVRRGKELGEADDTVFSQANSKQDQGAVGLLTDNAVDRTQLYAQAVILALIPFKNRMLYGPGRTA